MDKLQQLRALVRKRHDENWEKRNNSSCGTLCWERALVYADILAIIDSIPRFKVGDVIKSGSYTYTIKDMDEDSYILEGDKVLTFNAQYDWELVKEPQRMVSAKAKEAGYSKPVSEDLEEASKEWLRPQLDMSYINYGEGKMMELTHFDGYAMLDAIEFGAKWKEEQMMNDVVLETTIIKDWDGCAEDGNESEWLAYEDDEVINMPEWCEEGDKVKLILIKSEQP